MGARACACVLEHTLCVYTCTRTHTRARTRAHTRAHTHTQDLSGLRLHDVAKLLRAKLSTANVMNDDGTLPQPDGGAVPNSSGSPDTPIRNAAVQRFKALKLKHQQHTQNGPMSPPVGAETARLTPKASPEGRDRDRGGQGLNDDDVAWAELALKDLDKLRDDAQRAAEYEQRVAELSNREAELATTVGRLQEELSVTKRAANKAMSDAKQTEAASAVCVRVCMCVRACVCVRERER